MDDGVCVHHDMPIKKMHREDDEVEDGVYPINVVIELKQETAIQWIGTNRKMEDLSADKKNKGALLSMTCLLWLGKGLIVNK